MAGWGLGGGGLDRSGWGRIDQGRAGQGRFQDTLVTSSTALCPTQHGSQRLSQIAPVLLVNDSQPKLLELQGVCDECVRAYNDSCAAVGQTGIHRLPLSGFC